jgi:hypothetical protein
MMKSILKAVILAALAGSLFGALMRKRASQQRRLPVPTLKPLSDAEPHTEEPLKESDLRVAQNSPF